MKVLLGAALGSILLIGSANAGEVTRYGTVIGPYGGKTTYNQSRSCFDGRCALNGQATGPNGGVWTRSGSAYRVAHGQWNYTRQGTGPRGRSWNRSGSVTFSR
ncbi:MAG: hypothetical protein AAF724_01390 [Pseudomonadota bacterium]